MVDDLVGDGDEERTLSEPARLAAASPTKARKGT
jgi:hypothetical protein